MNERNAVRPAASGLPAGLERDARPIVWVAAVWLALGLACASATLLLFRDAFVDDAYISLRYAHQLLAGEGLVFNPGERVEGFTNLGHVLLVAALGKLGMDLEAAARAVGASGLLLAVGLAPAAILPGRQNRLARSLARLLCLANFPFVFLSLTGMETGLYAGAIATADWISARDPDRAGLALGLAMGALWMIRPDGLLIGLALLGVVAWRSGVASLLRGTGLWLWASIVLGTELWRLWYYGSLVPNTAWVKGVGGTMHVTAPWYGLVGDDAVEFLAGTGGAIALLLLPVAWRFHADRRPLHVAAAICAAVVAFELYAGGDWMVGYRFLVPMLPFYACLVAAGTIAAYTRIASTRLASLVTLGSGMAFVALYCWSFGLEFEARREQYPEYHMTSRPMASAASWLAEEYPAGTTVVASWIGALGYFTPLVVVDTVGLIDPVLARTNSAEERAAYLHARNPDLVLVAEHPTADFQRRRRLWDRDYEFVRSFRMGVEAPWLLFERTDRRRPPE